MQKNIIVEHEPNYDAKKSAFSFQQKAFDFCKDKKYSAIFHEQGLGKTKIGIDLLLHWLKSTDTDTVLIVTKKTLVMNWKKELSFHTHLQPRFLTSNKKDNYFIFNSPCRVIVTNFETILAEKERIKLFCKIRNVAIIIDESAKLKNPNSGLTKAFIELSPFFVRKIIMTGTPAANRPYDIWSQIFFLDNGKSLGSDFASFKRETDLPKNKDIGDEYSAVLEGIFDKVADFAIRETKQSAELSLPDKIYHDVWTLFTQDQWLLYKKIKDEMKIEITRPDGKVVLDDSHQALKRLLRLVQVTSNPKLINDEFTFKSGKEYELDRLIKQIVQEGQKAIIWTNFVKNVDYLYEKYHEKYGAVRFYGALGPQDREYAIDNFKNNSDVKIFIATPQSAKEGLTLTVANNAIFYDRGFSLDNYLQAQDRIHRISQDKTCHIYNIMIRGSIDEWINSLLLAKSKAAALTQSDIGKKVFDENMSYSYASIVEDILKSNKEIPHGEK